ncbi:MAG: iron-containing redox enzyme family protein, partial [Marmoricola sp.]
MHLPSPRGPMSNAVFCALRNERRMPANLASTDPDDLQITLWVLYELHYRGFEDVEDELEWDAEVLAARRRLERPFEDHLRRLASGLV